MITPPMKDSSPSLEQLTKNGSLDSQAVKSESPRVRRRSKTEPAISLSKYRRNNKNKDLTIQEKGGKNDDKTPGIIQNDVNLTSRLMKKVNAFPGEIASVIQAGTIGSIASFSGSQLVCTVADDSESVDNDIFNNFEFPLYNLVFEGGGNKGMAYVGVLQVNIFFFL